MNDYQQMQQRIVAHRRALHEIAEVGSYLPETAAYVMAVLDELGIPYRQCTQDSSIVALIEGSGEGPCLAFRADMDALPVSEETGLPFASRHEGCMHACGHDAHAAMLLGAAELLAARRDQFRGCVKLLFQADEERCTGAKKLIADGALEDPRVDALVSLHIGCLSTALHLGEVGIFPHGVMASCDDFTITVRGTSGHGSRPDNAVDPISAAAEIISTLQTLIARETNMLEPRVIAFCGIESSTVTSNVIPESVTIHGAIRALSAKTQQFMVERLREITESVGKAMRVDARAEIDFTLPVVDNDPALAAAVAAAARGALPEGKVITDQREPVMGSEDASYFHEKVPAVYCFLSSANPAKHTDVAHHNARFDIDEDVLWEGCALFTSTALHLLGTGADASDHFKKG